MAKKVEIKATVRGVGKVNRSIASIGTTFGKLRAKAVGMDSSLRKLRRSFLGLKAAIAVAAAGLILKKVTDSTIETAASFEQLEIKLNALTKGKGAETLERINKWALDMPVDTKKAVDAFAMMQAFGLEPTIEKMETLVDVATIFGEDTMPSIARALGQMQALGKLSAEELNQLSEVGINARQILKDTFGLTVEELQKQEVEIEKIIDALMVGMRDQFGGAARAGMSAWQGLKASFKSYITEIQRQIADAGAFGALKEQLGKINTRLKEWLANNRDLIKQKVPEYVERIKTISASLVNVFKVLIQDVATLGKFIFQLPTGLKLAAAAALLFGTALGRSVLILTGIESAIKSFPVLWNLFIESGAKAILFLQEKANQAIDIINKIPGISVEKIDTSGQKGLVEFYTSVTDESLKALDANKTFVQALIDSRGEIKEALKGTKDVQFDTTEAGLEEIKKKTTEAAEETVEAWRKALGKLEVATDEETGKAALVALENFKKIEASGEITGPRLAAVWRKYKGEIEPGLDLLSAEWQEYFNDIEKRFPDVVVTAKSSMSDLERNTRAAISSMKGPFTDFFDTANKGFLNLQGLVGNVVSVIRRKLAELAADRAIKFLTSALFGGATGGGGGFLSSIFGKRPHGGGHVGSLPTQKILTLHTGGLADDEIFAKLKKKEYVFNEGVTRDLGVNRLNRINSGDYSDFQGGGGGLTVLAPVTLNIHAIDPQSGVDFMSRQENLEVIEGFFRQVIIGNGGKSLGL